MNTLQFWPKLCKQTINFIGAEKFICTGLNPHANFELEILLVSIRKKKFLRISIDCLQNIKDNSERFRLALQNSNTIRARRKTKCDGKINEISVRNKKLSLHDIILKRYSINLNESEFGFLRSIIELVKLSYHRLIINKEILKNFFKKIIEKCCELKVNELSFEIYEKVHTNFKMFTEIDFYGFYLELSLFESKIVKEIFFCEMLE